MLPSAKTRVPLDITPQAWYMEAHHIHPQLKHGFEPSETLAGFYPPSTTFNNSWWKLLIPFSWYSSSAESLCSLLSQFPEHSGARLKYVRDHEGNRHVCCKTNLRVNNSTAKPLPVYPASYEADSFETRKYREHPNTVWGLLHGNKPKMKKINSSLKEAQIPLNHFPLRSTPLIFFFFV